MENNETKKSFKVKLSEIFNKYRKIGNIDFLFLLLVIALLITGTVMMYSASYAFAYYNFGSSSHFFVKQLFFAIVGIAIMFLFSIIDYRNFAKKKVAWAIFGIAILLLVIVKILPPMSEELYVKRWIVIGPITFQPSEIAKFAIIIIFSYLIVSFGNEKMKTIKYGIGPFLLIAGLTCVLVLIEPHISATVLIILIAITLLYIGGIKYKYIFAGLIAAVGAIAVAILTGVVGYGSDRIKYWLNPEADPTGAGYQTLQSLYAIGSGGLFGKGITQSRQKYLWVPEPQNDFIFGIVCEELGFIGAMAIILVFGWLIFRGIRIANRCPDKFGKLITIGIIAQIGYQMILNILVVTNTIPNTGISLPFFSYGGSALLMIMGEMGIILSVSRRSKNTIKRIKKVER